MKRTPIRTRAAGLRRTEKEEDDQYGHAAFY